MTITVNKIKELNPCDDRFNNFLKHYGKRPSFTSNQFMGFKHITQSDKMWVAFRLMDEEYIRFAAADIAELVLPIYESKYPNDNRPRKAIEAARATLLDVRVAREAAYAAARAAADADAAAANAANAAYTAYTAANAANDAYAANAAYAAYAAYYAAYYAANAADAAANAAANAASDRALMEKKIRAIVLKYWNKE